jgi:hypothetical protein
VNHLLHLRSVHVLFGPTAAATTRWAYVRLLVRHEFGVGKDGSMLEIIDSQSYRFRPGHRAKMPCQFELVRMCLLDRHPQLVARDVRVRLVRCHAFRRPVVHHAFRIVRSGQFMHLRESRRSAFQVGCRRINAGSRHQVRVDPALDLQVGIWLQAPGRADCRYASG